MQIAINAWTFPDGLSPEQRLAAAASAGFEGIELTLDADEALHFDTPVETFAALARRANDAGLQVVSLATGEFWRTNYAATDQAIRKRAVDLTLRMLDRAAALEAGAILVVPAVVGTWDQPQPQVSYVDALYRTFDALCRLRSEAESRGVTIALENVWNRFLLSPIEAVELVDRVNSPHVGWYLDTGNVLAHGYPQDWIATLAGRIQRVHVKDYDLARPGVAGFCALGEGSVDWPGVLAALRQVGYAGPLTYEGCGDPTQVCRSLRSLVNGQPIRKEDAPR